MLEKLRIEFSARHPLLESIAEKLEAETKEVLIGMPRIDRISFRAKGIDSFIKKVAKRTGDATYSSPLSEVEDQVAGRVLVFFYPDVVDIQMRLKEKFTAIESIRKQPMKDDEFGYESHHLVCQIPPHVLPEGWLSRADVPKTFEMQVRTLFMHAWAEPQHDLAYKAAADLPKEIRRELAWVAASAWGADKAFERVWEWQTRFSSDDARTQASD